MKAYRIDSWADGTEPYWEEEIYDEFEEDRSKNFVTLIEGNTGTGKSELCAYLSIRFEEEERPVLYVNKGDGLLTIATERIPNFCDEHDIPKPDQTDASRKLKELIKDLPRTVANNLASQAITELAEYDIEDNPTVLADFIEGRLESLLAKDQRSDQEELSSSSSALITVSDYKNNSDIQLFNDDEKWPATRAADELNQRLVNALEGRYDVPPIDQLLRQVGNKFTDTRPVFVLEDISITKSEADELRDFMEEDNPENNWDFVIAGTTDSTAPLKSQTAEARFQIYRTTQTPEAQEVPYLNAENAVEFIRPYLGYLKAHDGSIEYQRDQNNKIESLEAPPADSVCDNCGFCESEFRDYFPYNERFLQRLFENLDEPTPRAFINRVHRILDRWMLEEIQAPSDADIIQNIGFRTRPSDKVRSFSSSIANAALWFGELDESEDVFVVNRKFIDAFALIEDSWDLGKAPFEVTDSELRVPVSDASEFIKDIKGSEEELEDLKEEIDSHIESIRPWRDNPNSPESSILAVNTHITRGARILLEKLTQGFLVEPKAELKYSMGREKKPLKFYNFEGPRPDFEQDADRQSHEVLVDTHELPINLYEYMVALGIRDNYDRDLNPEQALKRFGSQLSSYADEWQSRIWEEEIDPSKTIYTNAGRSNDLADLALAAFGLVHLLSSPGSEISAETIVEWFDADEDNELKPSSSVDEIVDAEFSDEDYGHFQDLFSKTKDIEKLMVWQFGVVGSKLDKTEIEERLEQQSVFDILDTLGIGNINQNLRSDVQFISGDNISMSSLATDLYRVHDALTDVKERNTSLPACDKILTRLSGVNIESTKETARKIRDGYDIDSSFYEELGTFRSLDDDEIEEAITQSEFASALQGGPDQDQVQAILIEKRLERGRVYKMLQQIGKELDRIEDADRIGEQFGEVSSDYVSY